MDYQLLKVFIDDIMVRLRAHTAVANAHHEPYTDAQVNALIATHAAVVSAHHTDHQVASAEDADFKSVNIPAGEAYKQNNVNILKAKATGNIFIGEDSGHSHTSGVRNMFMGYYAGYSITSGDYNAFLGAYSGANNTIGYANMFMGYYAGYSNVDGYNNICIGTYAGYYNEDGCNNAFIGRAAGGSNTSGNNNAFIGYDAGFSNTVGDYNIFIGREAGYSNIAGNRNVFIGYQAGYNETGSDLLYIANSNAVIPLIWGDFANNIVGIHMKPAVSKFGVADIPEYADNAAAVTAGLTVGEFYRTGDVLKIVH